MTPKQLAVIEQARRTPARILEIAPRRGVRRGDALRNLRREDAERIAERVSALLEAELQRLVRTWWKAVSDRACECYK